MNTNETLKEEIINDYPRLKRQDSFKFACHPGVACFNKCCNDVNIFLTPYDIIRMKKRLNITSTAFLEKYTLLPLEEHLKHPIVMLKMNEGDLNCHFVTEKGCSIYEDRPWACRMYPLGVASAQNFNGGEGEFFFLLNEAVCQGFEEEKQWTISQWLDDQNVDEYNELGDMFREISLHEYFQSDKPIEPVKLEMFYMVCYDIDRFREFVFESTFLKRFDIDEEFVERARKDDVELLKLGFQWLRFSLFGEKTMRISRQYAEIM